MAYYVLKPQTVNKKMKGIDVITNSLKCILIMNTNRIQWVETLKNKGATTALDDSNFLNC